MPRHPVHPSLCIFVPGFLRQSETRGKSLATRFQAQLQRLGIPAEAAQVYRWSDHSPGLATMLGAGVGRLVAGAVATGGTALVAAAAGSAFGALRSYDSAVKRVEPAAASLARHIVEQMGLYRTIHLGAGSLGTEVLLRALRIVGREGYDVRGAAILLGGTASRRTDWGDGILAMRDGVVNVYNPSDGALFLNGLVRTRDVVGRAPLNDIGVENVRTALGHLEQLDGLADLLGDLTGADGRIRCAF